MKSVILDCGLVLALCDEDDRCHRPARTAVESFLAEGNRLAVPTTALSEVLTAAFRTNPYAVRMIDSFIDELVPDVPAVDRDIGRKAARLRVQHPHLSLGEALLIAAGQLTDASTVLTTNPALVGTDPAIRMIEV